MIDRLLTVRQVMGIIPMGKTTVTAIVKSLPHVTMNRKLMVYESSIRGWIAAHTQYPGEKAAKKQPMKRKPTLDDCYMLDENGMIPTRKALERMMKRKGGTA